MTANSTNAETAISNVTSDESEPQLLGGSFGHRIRQATGTV